MNSIDNSNTDNAMTSPVDRRENTSSAAMNANESASIRSTFSDESRADQQLRLADRTVHDSDQSKVVPEIEVSEAKAINLLPEIYRAVDDKNWTALNKLLNSVISSNLVTNELRDICQNIYARERCDAKLTYKAIDIFKFAVNNNQISLVEILLKTDLNVNVGDPTNDEFGQLRYAIMQGRAEIVKLLLDHRIDVAHADNSWHTLLGSASLYKKIECAKLLLDHGADVNGMSKDRNGHPRLPLSPLSSAVASGSTEMVMFLLNVGKANPNGGAGETPLSIAIRQENTKCVELLLEMGADATDAILDGSLLIMALGNQNIRTAMCLKLHSAK